MSPVNNENRICSKSYANAIIMEMDIQGLNLTDGVIDLDKNNPVFSKDIKEYIKTTITQDLGRYSNSTHPYTHQHNDILESIAYANKHLVGLEDTYIDLVAHNADALPLLKAMSFAKLDNPEQYEKWIDKIADYGAKNPENKKYLIEHLDVFETERNRYLSIVDSATLKDIKAHSPSVMDIQSKINEKLVEKEQAKLKQLHVLSQENTNAMLNNGNAKTAEKDNTLEQAVPAPEQQQKPKM